MKDAHAAREINNYICGLSIKPSTKHDRHVQQIMSELQPLWHRASRSLQYPSDHVQAGLDCLCPWWVGYDDICSRNGPHVQCSWMGWLRTPSMGAFETASSCDKRCHLYTVTLKKNKAHWFWHFPALCMAFMSLVLVWLFPIYDAFYTFQRSLIVPNYYLLSWIDCIFTANAFVSTQESRLCLR